MQATELRGWIVAVVTDQPDRVLPGGCPVFVGRNASERERIATVLGKVLRAATHDLGDGTWVLIRH